MAYWLCSSLSNHTVNLSSILTAFLSAGCRFPDEDASNVQIMCAWCQKVGVKRYSLSMGSELKSFCSEKCFAACRRAYFKRNKVTLLSSSSALTRHLLSAPETVLDTNLLATTRDC